MLQTVRVFTFFKLYVICNYINGLQTGALQRLILGNIAKPIKCIAEFPSSKLSCLDSESGLPNFETKSETESETSPKIRVSVYESDTTSTIINVEIESEFESQEIRAFESEARNSGRF